MKKFLIIVCFGLCLGTHVVSAQNTQTKDKAPTGTWQILIEAIQDYQSLNESIRTKTIALDFEKNLSFPSLKELDRIKLLLEGAQKNLELLLANKTDVDTETWLQDKSDLEQEISLLTAEQQRYEATYEGRKEKQEANIRLITEELSNLTEDVEKQRTLIRVQLEILLRYVIIFVVLSSAFFGLRFFSSRLIRRFAANLTEARRKTLLQINKVFFNILLGILITGLVFSQFANLLSILAILGTGLAFAIRDAIASFIAWFVIGTDRGYRVGDQIEVEQIKGKVIEITPLLTALRDNSAGWNTGKVITMPNKVIFDQKIFNASRSFNFVPVSVEFCLTADSDLLNARLVLQELIEIHNVFSVEKIKNRRVKILAEQTYSEGDLTPAIFIEPSVNGIWLRSRFLVRREYTDDVKYKIKEAFFLVVQKNDQIFFQFSKLDEKSCEKS